MDLLNVNLSTRRPVIEAEIITLQPEVAINLEQLRYLVFQGQKGDPGQSAYALAVSLGFEGTEQDWLDSLVGPQGNPGEPGPRGERGPTGATGADGKNYGIVVDDSTANVLELKSLEMETTAVTSVNGKSGAVTLAAADVGALPDTTEIPSVPEEAVKIGVLAYETNGTARLLTNLYDLRNQMKENVKLYANVMLTRQLLPTPDVLNVDTDLIVSDLDLQSGTATLCVPWDGAWHALTLSAPNQMTNLSGTFTTLHWPTEAESAEWSGKQDALTFDEAPVAESRNPVTSGGVFAALQTVPRAGWRDISAAVGFTNAGTLVSSVDAVEAWFCEALGIVRFCLAVTTTRVNGSTSSPVSIDVFFDPSKPYQPYYMGASNVALGVLNAHHGNNRINSASITKASRGGQLLPDLQVLTTAAPDTVETMYLAGFYYTEDLPVTGGEQ